MLLLLLVSTVATGAQVLAGTVAGAGAVTARVVTQTALIATAPATGSATAVLRRTVKLVGTSNAVGVTSGTIGQAGRSVLSGSILATSTVTGGIGRPVRLYGVISTSNVNHGILGIAQPAVSVQGSLYTTTGVKVTTGALYIRPEAPFVWGNNLVVINTVTVSIPPSGDLSFQLVSAGATAYLVEYDPSPSDTSIPRSMKSGYFATRWQIPSSGPVQLSSL